jgi:hypothetical protein
MNVIHYPFPPHGEPTPVLNRRLYPAPLHTSLMEPKDPIPGPVLLLKQHAERCGWQALSPRQAIGFLPHAAHGTPGKEAKVSWSLKMMQGSRRAVAVQSGGSWRSFWTWSDQEFFRRYGTLTEFKEALR